MWFLPLLGKLLDIPGAIAAYFNKKQDVDLEKYKVRGNIDVKAMETDVSVIQARTQLAIVMKDDPTNRWGRRLIIYPTGIWYTAVVIRSIFQENSIVGDYTWVIAALPSNLDYIPYAVVAYLLVTAWRKP